MVAAATKFGALRKVAHSSAVNAVLVVNFFSLMSFYGTIVEGVFKSRFRGKSNTTTGENFASKYIERPFSLAIAGRTRYSEAFNMASIFQRMSLLSPRNLSLLVLVLGIIAYATVGLKKPTPIATPIPNEATAADKKSRIQHDVYTRRRAGSPRF